MNEMSLDEQCARAMGFPMFRYSTDPALLDAKLEWLAERSAFAEVTLIVQASGLTEASMTPRDTGVFIEEWGTIHEATARLVVAVAERLRAEKCPECEGTGYEVQVDWPGEFANQSQVPCSKCGGRKEKP